MGRTALTGLLTIMVMCVPGSVISCPEECQCSAQLADCSGRNLKYVPYNLPATLTVLRLDGNSIRNVPNDAFLGMENLQILSLARNEIDDIPPGTFLNTPHLMSLDLSQNSLRYLDRDIFKGLRDLTTLSMAHNTLQTLTGVLQHTPNLGSVNLGHNQLRELTHQDLKLTSKIKMLDLSNNQISRVHGDAFRNISSLRYLFIQNNPLGPELPDMNFTNTRLQVVDFTNCSLTKIPHVLPPTVNDLRLSKNMITVVDETDIRNITRLQMLALNNNKITNVLYRTFRGLEHLKELWLSHNMMVYVPRGLPSSLNKLYMGNNLIEQMEENLFKNDSQLQYLSMEMNRIEMIPPGAFNNMQNLKLLDLKANRVKALKAGTFSNLPSLDYLDLSSNPIETIAAGTFEDLENVTKLGMSHVMSTMTDIGDNFLGEMPNLVTIELVNSPGLAKGIMKILQTASFTPLPNATSVHLMYCDLRTLPAEIWELVPNVRELLLDDNPWMCDTRIRWLKHWMTTSDVTFSRNAPVVCVQPAELKGQNIAQVADRDFIEPVEDFAQEAQPEELNADTPDTGDLERSPRQPTTEDTTVDTTTSPPTTTTTAAATTTTTVEPPTSATGVRMAAPNRGSRPYNPFYNRQKVQPRRHRPTTSSPGENGVTNAAGVNRAIRRRKFHRRRNRRRRLRMRKRKLRRNGPTLRNLHVRHPRKKAEQIARWRKQAEQQAASA